MAHTPDVDLRIDEGADQVWLDDTYGGAGSAGGHGTGGYDEHGAALGGGRGSGGGFGWPPGPLDMYPWEIVALTFLTFYLLNMFFARKRKRAVMQFWTNLLGDHFLKYFWHAGHGGEQLVPGSVFSSLNASLATCWVTGLKGSPPRIKGCYVTVKLGPYDDLVTQALSWFGICESPVDRVVFEIFASAPQGSIGTLGAVVRKAWLEDAKTIVPMLRRCCSLVPSPFKDATDVLREMDDKTVEKLLVKHGARPVAAGYDDDAPKSAIEDADRQAKEALSGTVTRTQLRRDALRAGTGFVAFFEHKDFATGLFAPSKLLVQGRDGGRVDDAVTSTAVFASHKKKKGSGKGVNSPRGGRSKNAQDEQDGDSDDGLVLPQVEAILCAAEACLVSLIVSNADSHHDAVMGHGDRLSKPFVRLEVKLPPQPSSRAHGSDVLRLLDWALALAATECSGPVVSQAATKRYRQHRETLAKEEKQRQVQEEQSAHQAKVKGAMDRMTRAEREALAERKAKRKQRKGKVMMVPM